MLVDTYETPEVNEGGIIECVSESIELIESLNLEGQRKLIKPDENGDSKRVPYPKMTKEQKAVIKAICPKESNLSDYSDQAIPLRVLQVAAHANEMFDRILVWHPENADEKDPYLIGRNGEGWGDKEYYMLARWGEELLPWSEMTSKAAKILRGKRLEILRKTQSLINADITTTESADDEVVIGLDQSPSYSQYS